MTRTLRSLLGLGLDSAHLGIGQMAARAVVVFIFSILLVKLGARRFLGHSASYDIMLLVVLGSVLSRAINGRAAFTSTLTACLVLVLLHRLLGILACRFHWFSVFTKGRARLLVRDGVVDPEALKRAGITHDDLLENLRLNGAIDELARVRQAQLERSGEISVLKRP